MFDTEALDTLAALCGSAGGSASCSAGGSSASSSTPPTPLSYTLNRFSTPNYALLAQRQQLQLQDAHHAAMVAHQQQAQAHVGLSTIPSDIEILQAYLARTTAGISTGSGISAIPSPDGLGLAGLSSAANGVNLHNAASSFRRFGASPGNDMYHLEARTMAANIFITQQRRHNMEQQHQQQQWSGQTHLLQQQNSRSPGFTTLDHHLPPVPPVTADTPQYPQAFQSLSPSLHNISPLSSQLLTANAHRLNNTQPFKVSSQLLPEAKQSHRLVESNREANECPPLYHLEARTMAANIFITQQRRHNMEQQHQQQQWSGQTHLLQQQNSRSPGFTTLDHHLPPVPPVTADTPQYPQAFQSLSPSLHNISPLSSQLLTANAHRLNNTQPFKVSSQLLPEAKQSHRLVESNREANECPPLKKRLMERRKLDGGVTVGRNSSSSTLGSAMFTWERKKEAKKAANRYEMLISV